MFHLSYTNNPLITLNNSFSYTDDKVEYFPCENHLTGYGGHVMVAGGSAQVSGKRGKKERKKREKEMCLKPRLWNYIYLENYILKNYFSHSKSV